ncbi:heparin lyase I family protein [Pedobacter lusitanus]|uniref:heparin lyase I family protein n=1 Tax=Pedobacter lusitanus TaxID=1503925 RepID=UPI0006969BFD|nr:heparin lyase I family protein [Pedobacter lusitanus]
MKNPIRNQGQYIALAVVLLISCSKKDLITEQNGLQSNTLKTTLPVGLSPSTHNGDTLLYINYESGSLNSGISGLNTTNASAPDASYLVPVAHSGNYAIAHKVTIGDNGYFSDNNWRSESATAQLTAGKYLRGDERRYEFSLLLKDWKTYVPGMSQAGDIIFQGKLGGGGNPAWYFMTKRNAIVFRMPNNDRQETIIPDFTSYINQWLDFRVDVKWVDGPTGYYKVYKKLPGEADYTLIWHIENFHTFLPDNPNAVSGYNKWGLYRPGQSLANGDVATRIIYHDDIRIIQLPL